MRIILMFFLAFFCFVIWMPSLAVADSCPCCGQAYGTPAPGDEARVYELRQIHEASCCRQPPGQGYQQQPDMNQRQQQEEQRKREAEKEAKRLEEARQKQFQQDKQDALDMLKSGAGPTGLKGGSKSGALKLKGGSEDALKLKAPQTSKASKPKGVKFREVPSPAGYKSKSERRAMAAALSDEHLTEALKQTKRLLKKMSKDLLGKSAKLEELLDETKDAEKQAVNVSLGLLTSGVISKLPEGTELERNMKFILDRANKLQGHHETLKTQSDLEMGRSVLLDAYDTLAEHSGAFTQSGESVASKARAKYAALGSFAVDYSYQVMRWAVARNELQIIIDNLDKPGGELDAQKALGRFYEDLVQERKRRGLPSASQ